MKLIHPESTLTIDVAASVAERYFSQGWREPTRGAPKANASLKVWQEFARKQGLSDEDIEGQSREDLRAALA